MQRLDSRIRLTTKSLYELDEYMYISIWWNWSCHKWPNFYPTWQLQPQFLWKPFTHHTPKHIHASQHYSIDEPISPVFSIATTNFLTFSPIIASRFCSIFNCFSPFTCVESNYWLKLTNSSVRDLNCENILGNEGREPFFVNGVLCWLMGTY